MVIQAVRGEGGRGWSYEKGPVPLFKEGDVVWRGRNGRRFRCVYVSRTNTVVVPSFSSESSGKG